MAGAAAGLLIMFGLLHLVGAVSNGESRAHPASTSLWLAACAGCVIAAVLLLRGRHGAAALLGAASLAVLVGLAVLNGFRIHGSPTWSHHAVRAGVALMTATLVLRVGAIRG